MFRFRLDLLRRPSACERGTLSLRRRAPPADGAKTQAGGAAIFGWTHVSESQKGQKGHLRIRTTGRRQTGTAARRPTSCYCKDKVTGSLPARSAAAEDAEKEKGSPGTAISQKAAFHQSADSLPERMVDHAILTQPTLAGWEHQQADGLAQEAIRQKSTPERARRGMSRPASHASQRIALGAPASHDTCRFAHEAQVSSSSSNAQALAGAPLLTCASLE